MVVEGMTGGAELYCCCDTREGGGVGNAMEEDAGDAIIIMGGCDTTICIWLWIRGGWGKAGIPPCRSPGGGGTMEPCEENLDCKTGGAPATTGGPKDRLEGGTGGKTRPAACCIIFI